MLIILLFFLIEGFIFFILNQIVSPSEGTFEVASVIIIFVNTFLYMLVIRKYAKSKKEYVIFLLAYGVRIFILFWDIYAKGIFILPNSGADSEMFHYYATQFANHGNIEGGGFYTIVIGVIYKLFGESRILAQYFNILLSIFTIIFIKKSLDRFAIEDKSKFFVLVLISFLPNFIIISSLLLRESLIIFLISASLFYFIMWWQKGRVSSLIIALFLPLGAAVFHSGAIALTSAYLLCVLFYSRKKNKYIINLKTVGSGLLIILFIIIVNSLFGNFIFSKFQNVDSVTDVSNKISAYTDGGSAYLEGQKPDSIVNIVLLTPIRMFYFIASPLPWDWRGFNDIFAFSLSSLFYIVCYLGAIRALFFKQIENKKILIAFIIMALLSTLLFSWGVSNSGSALRHREKFLGIYIVVFALSFSRSNYKKDKIYIN